MADVLHNRSECKTVMYNFGHHCQDCVEEDIVEVFYQCAQCRPEYKLCEYCFAVGKMVAGELVKEYATDEEAPWEKMS